MNIEDIIQNSGHLPASHISQAVNKALTDNSSLVITAPPGAGKSTLLPLTILQGFIWNNKDNDKLTPANGKVLMLEPRRLAARQIAERMANILKEPVGNTVGYRVRFDSKVSKDTCIEVLTEGILSRMLIDDPTLDGISVVIFDEFHERSINSDLALALVRKIQSLIRPDIRIVIMSATIDTQSICQALHAPLIQAEGRMFPVTIYNAQEDCNKYEIPKVTTKAIINALRDNNGDVLVFLPGQSEIQRCLELLRDIDYKELDSKSQDKRRLKIYPLYGNLSNEEQRKAIMPAQANERKIVLATSIAETSLTINGIKVVVDSGFCRNLVYDAHKGLSYLETVKISLDMANQRAGRAGRVDKGVCYRLWTKASEYQMDEQRKPEILTADLSTLVLQATAFGENDIYALPWLTPPPSSRIIQAVNLLENLGAINKKEATNEPAQSKNQEEKQSSLQKNTSDITAGLEITPLGREMVAMPCQPRISRMILEANTNEEKAIACDIAALLSERDPMPEEEDCDICLRLNALQTSCSRKTSQQGRWKRIAQISKEYKRLIHTNSFSQETVDPHIVGRLLAYAFPERIARATDNLGNFKMASGDLIHIEQSSILAVHNWIVAVTVNVADGASSCKHSKVHLAAALDIDDFRQHAQLNGMKGIGSLIRETDNIAWDNKQGCVVMQREQRLGKLVIESKPIHDGNKSQIIEVICEATKKYGLSMLNWDEHVQRLQKRVSQVAMWHPELKIPDLSTHVLLLTTRQWLPYYLESNGRVLSSIAELKKLHLDEILWNSIPYETQEAINTLAPTHIQMPTGSRIRIEYRPGIGAPILGVRLQECFGMQTTPCVNGGQQPVLMELLSPGFKPVQLTQDLQSFWQGTYYEVRKELKRRYPKHYWPENPLEAEATKGVRKQKKC